MVPKTGLLLRRHMRSDGINYFSANFHLCPYLQIPDQIFFRRGRLRPSEMSGETEPQTSAFFNNDLRNFALRMFIYPLIYSITFENLGHGLRTLVFELFLSTTSYEILILRTFAFLRCLKRCHISAMWTEVRSDVMERSCNLQMPLEKLKTASRIQYFFVFLLNLICLLTDAAGF